MITLAAPCPAPKRNTIDRSNTRKFTGRKLLFSSSKTLNFTMAGGKPRIPAGAIPNSASFILGGLAG